MEEMCTEDLDRYDEDDEVFCERFWPTELRYLGRSCQDYCINECIKVTGITNLRMGFYDRLPARPMRLFGVGPEEIVLLDVERRRGFVLGALGFCGGFTQTGRPPLGSDRGHRGRHSEVEG